MTGLLVSTFHAVGLVAAARAASYVAAGSDLIITAVASVDGSAGTVIAAGSKYRQAAVGGAVTVCQFAG